jgi:murein L,D-transpeptidase YafK
MKPGWLPSGIRGLLALAAALFCLAVMLPAQQPSTPERADSVLILKKDHVLQLLAGGKVIKTYNVALGQGGLAAKEREGDGRTPEGHYVIDSRNPDSHYHMALHVSYPNADDRKRAAKLGVAPGGAIMIHGLPKGQGWIGAAHRLHDWTLGCIAVTDSEIEEIWKLVPTGTPVEIRP